MALKDLSIKYKTLLFIGGSVLIALVVLFAVIFYQFQLLERQSVDDIKTVITENDELRIKHLVKTKVQNLSRFHRELESSLSKKELEEIMVEINNETWFDFDGYFFIYNYEADTIALPPQPEIEGDNRWDLQDPNGKYILREFIKKVEAGGGFVDYDYLNPANNEVETKFSYVEPIPGTDYFIGTGSYYSFIEENVADASGRMIKQQENILVFILIAFIVILLLTGIVIFIFSNYITRELNKVVKYSQSIASKDFTTDSDIGFIKEELKDCSGQMSKDWLKRGDELGVLSRSYKAMKDNLIRLVKRLQESVENLAMYSEEVTELNQRLEYQALHDPLTELPNRRSFIKQLEQELKNEQKGAVLLLDLDNFKEINDTLGHIFGDQLLKEVGRRLLKLEADNIFVARYGGDEFLLLLKDDYQIKDIKKQLNKLNQIFTRSFLIQTEELELDYSVGVALYPFDGDNTNQLITNADTAMYQAKESGKEYLCYNKEMIKRLEEKKEIKEILKKALKEDGFELKYQPQINLKTGKADYVEALIRLKDFAISPGKFIPVAERINLIIKIGRWVTKEAINQLAAWRAKGLTEKVVSINFSVKQLRDEGYIDFIEQELARAEIPARLIEIEVTESILLGQEEKAIEFFTKLKDLGIKIALDDFGTGYSSFNYLTYIDLDRVKLDKSLSDKFLDEKDLGTINSLIDLFHNLDLPIVAEGIETKQQYEKLKSKGCDYIQGYLFSRPVGVKQLEEIYDKNFLKFD